MGEKKKHLWQREESFRKNKVNLQQDRKKSLQNEENSRKNKENSQ